ncbi:hypothetical protein POVWA2_039300 [Plasmodium ovale wallikeri]|nr:hypothetical protein POVWA2_039300 [Plasmodium ovale wallikeri]
MTAFRAAFASICSARNNDRDRDCILPCECLVVFVPFKHSSPPHRWLHFTETLRPSRFTNPFHQPVSSTSFINPFRVLFTHFYVPIISGNSVVIFGHIPFHS